MKNTYTLYVANQKVWGSDSLMYHYFETIKDRNAFVRSTDYASVGGTVKLNETQYYQFKQYGSWDSDAE